MATATKRTEPRTIRDYEPFVEAEERLYELRAEHKALQREIAAVEAAVSTGLVDRLTRAANAMIHAKPKAGAVVDEEAVRLDRLCVVLVALRFISYHPTLSASGSFPPQLLMFLPVKRAVVVPARQAYSHSASVGRR